MLSLRSILIELKLDIKELLSKKDYISKKQVKEKLDIYRDIYLALKNKNIKKDIIYDAKSRREIIIQIEKVIKEVKKHNDKYINQALKKYQKYFDNMFKKVDPNVILDEEQRIAILTDEDYILLIAGAGAGKTTTMAAKVKFLVDKKGVRPEDIMLISYTNKAVNELRERINNDFKLDVKIATFHAFGLLLIKEHTTFRHLKIITNPYNILNEYFNSYVINNKELINKLLEFFNYYLDIPAKSLKFNSLAEYHYYKANNDYITLKTRLKVHNQEAIDKRKEKYRTILNEYVRSSEEVTIANFLYLNNITYEYEQIYPYVIDNKKSYYEPDFTIYYGNNIYYLEHFGINEDGYNNQMSYKENVLYQKGITYKKRLHKKNNTTLICTYSSYKDKRSLLEHLKEELLKHNIELRPKDEREIYKKLVVTGRDIYFSRFIVFCLDFIRTFKTRGFTIESFNELIHKTTDERVKVFLKVMIPMYQYYQNVLKQNNLIDFEDMINEACLLLENNPNIDLNYKYVIIDEYQDIATQRFNLTKLISSVASAKVVAVGDDWQAIFSFAGSDINLFTDFEKEMGYASILNICHTYRNSQELIDIAGKFVTQNIHQIKKKLISPKHLKEPIKFYPYDDSNYILVNKNNMLKQIIDEIVVEMGEEKSILILGRFNFEISQIIKDDSFIKLSSEKLCYTKYPKLKIIFMTSHSSKGLGYDNVIIYNGANNKFGFPSQIKTDPIIKAITVEDLGIEYAEERRLFYVSLTRTKNRIYLLYPENNPSYFVSEILEYVPNHRKIKAKKRKQVTCPRCSYPLIKERSSLAYPTVIYRCSNDKELCDFKTNNLEEKFSIKKCPKCSDGYLILKMNKKTQEYFIGCSNYRNSTNQCNYNEKYQGKKE